MLSSWSCSAPKKRGYSRKASLSRAASAAALASVPSKTVVVVVVSRTDPDDDVVDVDDVDDVTSSSALDVVEIKLSSSCLLEPIFFLLCRLEPTFSTTSSTSRRTRR